MALAWINATYTHDRLMRHSRALLAILASFQFLWAGLYLSGIAEIPIYTTSTPQQAERKVLFPYEVTKAEKQHREDVTLGFGVFSFLIGVIYLVGSILKFFWFRFALILVWVISASVQVWNGSIVNIIYACVGVWFLYKMIEHRDVTTTKT